MISRGLSGQFLHLLILHVCLYHNGGEVTWHALSLTLVDMVGDSHGKTRGCYIHRREPRSSAKMAASYMELQGECIRHIFFLSLRVESKVHTQHMFPL